MTYNRSVDLASMPDRIRRLRVSPEGWPVPWFVEWFKDGKPCEDGDGVPDFRVVNPRKIVTAIKQHKCWVCGDGPLGIYKCFVIGPMCAVNRVISEPPSHRECAIYAARICPFLSKPNMVRNEKGMFDPNGKPHAGLQEAPGFHLARNPGAGLGHEELQAFQPGARPPRRAVQSRPSGRDALVCQGTARDPQGSAGEHRRRLSNAGRDGAPRRPRSARRAGDAAPICNRAGAGAMKQRF